MGGGLGVSKGKFQSRLTLSLEAIKMFISKLRPTDSVGLITFDDEAYVIFEPTLRENISDNIFDELDKIKTKGGTTIRSGFDMSKKLLLKYLNKNENSNC
jgi:Mg-chelatase subunit ChlD